MTISAEQLQAYMAQKKGSEISYPFGPDAEVYKVMGKMFALINISKAPLRVNLKCDPDFALALRDQYQSITPGYHMNKKHWNTIELDGDVPEAEIRSLIDHSYSLVVKKLKKKDREYLDNL